MFIKVVNALHGCKSDARILKLSHEHAMQLIHAGTTPTAAAKAARQLAQREAAKAANEARVAPAVAAAGVAAVGASADVHEAAAADGDGVEMDDADAGSLGALSSGPLSADEGGYEDAVSRWDVLADKVQQTQQEQKDKYSRLLQENQKRRKTSLQRSQYTTSCTQRASSCTQVSGDGILCQHCLTTEMRVVADEQCDSKTRVPIGLAVQCACLAREGRASCLF